MLCYIFWILFQMQFDMFNTAHKNKTSFVWRCCGAHIHDRIKVAAKVPCHPSRNPSSQKTLVHGIDAPRCLDENISAPLCVRYVASPKFFYKVGKGGLIVPYKFLVGMLDQTTLTMS